MPLGQTLFGNSKGLFTPSVSVDVCVDAVERVWDLFSSITEASLCLNGTIVNLSLLAFVGVTGL